MIILLNTRLAFGISVIPGGESIGVVVDYNGVVISGHYDFEINGETINPKDNDINIGDIIIKVNGHAINNSDDLVEKLYDSLTNNQDVILTLQRDNEVIERKLEVYFDKSSSNFKTGLYIKDSISGIGTVTFYDPSTFTYGALGHKLSDDALSVEVTLDAGTVFTSYVVNVTRSENKNPGEKIATIDKTSKIGDIKINNDFGIYGSYSNIFKEDTRTIESATIDEVELGRAEILTVIDGDKVESFEIEIVELKKQTQPETKGIVFKITDEKLLNTTNGIVQGMSGSPIIQNGKLVGSVTHVVINEVDYGYGLYIEWMLEENLKQ